MKKKKKEEMKAKEKDNQYKLKRPMAIAIMWVNEAVFLQGDGKKSLRAGGVILCFIFI